MEPKSFGTCVVGSNALVREGLVRILGSGYFRIIASAVTVGDLLANSISTTDPVLLVIDVCEDFDGAIQQIGRFKKEHPAARIVLLAHQHRLDKVIDAYRSGANAFFFDVTSCEEFIRSLELVMYGITLIPPELAGIFAHQNVNSHDNAGNVAIRENGNQYLLHLFPPGDQDDGLTPNLSTRQKSILRCLLDGDSNKVIARRIAIAEATVKVHVKAILRKIRVHNRTQAAVWAMSHGPLLTNKDPSRVDTAAASEPACNGARSDLVRREEQQVAAIVHAETSNGNKPH